MPRLFVVPLNGRAIFRRVRYFLTRGHARINSVLLVESGSRDLLERLIPHFRQSWGNQVRIDLVSCYGSRPEGFDPESTQLYSVADYRGRQGRRKLYRQLIENGYAFVGIVCSGEPLMTKWKWALALRIPAKVFIINENGDYFWLDRHHWNIIVRFVLYRSGLEGAGAVRILIRLIAFPFTFLYLLLYATTVHARRALRRG